MGLASRFRQWKSARQEQHIEALTAQAADLSESQNYDLLFLHHRKLVRARGTGQSITQIYGEVENLVRKTLNVTVAPGTYFVASGGHQNMATTEERSFRLDPCSSSRLAMKAVCVNANRPIPKEKDRFSGVARVSESVARFLAAAASEDPMTIQAGVWALTDNYTRSAAINHLIARDSRGNTSHPITPEHCSRAWEILDELGLPHQLWISPVPYEKKTVEFGNGTYAGEFRHGDKHGHGTYTFENGDVYEGEWRYGKRSGQGRYTFAAGGYCEGSWKNNTLHGDGTYVFPNGEKYIGAFDDGRHTGGWQHFPDGRRLWVYQEERDGPWITSDSPGGPPHGRPDSEARRGPDPASSRAESRRRDQDDGWRFCVKCRRSDFWVQTSIQQQRWKAGRCPYCEGELIDRATHARTRGK